MRITRVLGAIFASGLALGGAACSEGESDFRTGIEQGFEDLGFDATDEEIDCLTDRTTESFESGLDEVEGEISEPRGRRERVRQRSRTSRPRELAELLTSSMTESFEECEIDPSEVAGS